MSKNNITYVNSSLVNGICIPPPVQSLFVREYCKKIKKPFPLPSNEVGGLGKYPVLQKLLIEEYSEAFFVSHLLIPKFTHFPLRELKIHDKTNYHFILEREIIEGKDLKEFIKTRDLMKIFSNFKRVSGQINKNIK